MTGVPQDDRSPFRQTRWIEATNNGSSTIPAHGAVEVVSNTVVGAEFREVFSVRRPTNYGLPNIAINGLMPIKVGKTGFVTKDYPANFMGAAGLTVGMMAGTQPNSYLLAKGYPGVMVEGNGPSSGLYRGTYLWSPATRGVLSSTICPDDPTGSVGSFWVARVDMGAITADNAFGLAGIGGEAVELTWNGLANGTGRWEIVQIHHRMKTITTDVTRNVCEVDKTLLDKVALMYCGSEVTSIVIPTKVVTVVTGAKIESIASPGNPLIRTCELQNAFTDICVIDAGVQSAYSTILGGVFSPMPVLQDLRQLDLCLQIRIATAYVPCQDAGAWVNAVCGVECTTSTTGGGGGGGGTTPATPTSPTTPTFFRSPSMRPGGPWLKQ